VPLRGTKPSLADAWKRLWQRLFPNALRPIGIGAALVCFGLLVLEVHVHRSGGPSTQEGADKRADKTMYVVDVPIQTETHLFLRQNNMIVDTLVAEVSVGHAGWEETNER
jgi:hypothetical protein